MKNKFQVPIDKINSFGELCLDIMIDFKAKEKSIQSHYVDQNN
jgi:hypothetical protein